MGLDIRHRFTDQPYRSTATAVVAGAGAGAMVGATTGSRSAAGIGALVGAGIGYAAGSTLSIWHGYREDGDPDIGRLLGRGALFGAVGGAAIAGATELLTGGPRAMVPIALLGAAGGALLGLFAAGGVGLASDVAAGDAPPRGRHVYVHQRP